jgi:hypothetical protein
VFLSVSLARADVIFTLNQSQSNGSGPFATILLHELGDGITVQVTETLFPGEVFAHASGETLEFNVDVPVSYVPAFFPSGFTTGVNDTASPFGTFSNFISCIPICGNGTSPPQYSGPLTFQVFNSAGLRISDFIPNGSGYYFASDIGVSDGKGGFNTFNVATSVPGVPGPPPNVPEPTSVVLIATGLACGELFRRRRFR